MAAYHRLGRGYNNSSFQAADVASALALVRSLGAVPIFTNDCGAVYLSGRSLRLSIPFPRRDEGYGRRCRSLRRPPRLLRLLLDARPQEGVGG